MKTVNDFRFRLGKSEYVPIVTGGMGVFFSTPELALEACRLGGVGHITDAMSPFVSDSRYGTRFTQAKANRHKGLPVQAARPEIKFDLEDLYQAQFNHISKTMERKTGSGAIFVNVMEKLGMGAPLETLRVRLHAALDGGVDGVTLAAGLHCQSLKLIEDNPRFRDVKIGIIVSSARALKIFLRGAERSHRLPDYVIVEGPLAGGHLGFGDDWREYNLKQIVGETLAFLKEQELDIPVIPAGGIFTGSDAVGYLESGAAAVQVATRFVVTKECGAPDKVKQHYFRAEEDDVEVNHASPTGYLMRMLKSSPCLQSSIKPCCEALGYVLDREGKCQYLEAWTKSEAARQGAKGGFLGKVCLCYHFSKSSCYTCGHNVFRLKDTSRRKEDGSYQLLSAEHVFRDYQYSKEHQILLPDPELEIAANSAKEVGQAARP